MDTYTPMTLEQAIEYGNEQATDPFYGLPNSTQYKKLIIEYVNDINVQHNTLPGV
jgi:hypothetical protein